MSRQDGLDLAEVLTSLPRAQQARLWSGIASMLREFRPHVFCAQAWGHGLGRGEECSVPACVMCVCDMRVMCVCRETHLIDGLDCGGNNRGAV